MSDIPTSIARYQIIRLLGKGGMGEVHLARDTRLNRQVVLKFPGNWIDDGDTRKRFAREAQAAGGLRHPNLVTIFDVDELDERPFIVMEYVPGETLQELIARQADLPLSRKLRVIEDLACGVAHAHAAGIIHRDIKPSNVIVDESGVVKVLDFGIAKTAGTPLTRPGAIPGTLNYLAPELIISGTLDHRADIFAVGAVMYELVSGRQAFPGTVHDGVLGRISVEEPPPLNVDREVEAIVARALAKRPEDRFATLLDMRAELERTRKRIEAGHTTVVRVRPELPDVITGPESAAHAPAPVSPSPSLIARRLFEGAAPRFRISPSNLVFLSGAVVLVAASALTWSLTREAPVDPGQVRPETAKPAPPPIAGQIAAAESEAAQNRKKQGEMVWIPADEFLMGSPPLEAGRRDNEGPQQPMRITSGFWLDTTEVTNAAYQRFVLASPSWQKGQPAAALANTDLYLREWMGTVAPLGLAGRPVTSVSWHAARAYCEWAGKRLPTEAEWEYAARAATTTAYWWGDKWDATRAVGNRSAGTEDVGDARRVNPWGLADMAGNVWEWTSTQLRPYPYRPDDGREDPNGNGDRVVRGGSWHGSPDLLRSANRGAIRPAGTDVYIGFRCAQ